jgi:NitT/TauT family transport system permease protein
MALDISQARAIDDMPQRGPQVRKFLDRHFNLLIGSISTTGAILLWEFARPLGIAGVSLLEPPSAVIAASADLLQSPTFWIACYKSMIRILIGFLIAQLIGIPLGILMATNRISFNTIFPITEILRPVPPVAWIPIAIIFWPTREASTIFIIFLGAFWIVLLNTIGGTSAIDPAYRRAALSLGSSRWHLFRYIIFPASLPSIVTGMVVGMGICWEMVVAAEMIAGDTGLGYLLWQSFEINARAQVIVCMIAIGIAGFASSALIRRLGRLLTPWDSGR